MRMNRSREREPRNHGFTIVELLVALTILVLAAAAFLPIFTFTAKANKQNKINSTANAIAAAQFEKVSGMKFDNIGTQGGNPVGSIPQTTIQAIDGINYEVQTLISWGAVTSAGGISATDIAYKNIRVIVSATGAFSGVSAPVDKMFSLSSREGEVDLPDTGNIRATVYDASDKVISNSPVTVELSRTGYSTSTMITDYAGKVLFGDLALANNYVIKATLLSDYSVPPGEIMDGSKIVRSGVTTTKWATTDVKYYMDKTSNMGKVAITFIDQDSNVIKPTGTVKSNWVKDGTTYSNVINKNITASDYVGNTLPESFLGNFWPRGNYSLNFTSLKDTSYLYSVASVKAKGVNWDGSFNTLGEQVSITVSLIKRPRKLLYSEDQYNDFNNSKVFTGTNGTSNIQYVWGTAPDGMVQITKGFTLTNSAIETRVTYVSASSTVSNYTNLFDGNTGTYTTFTNPQNGENNTSLYFNIGDYSNFNPAFKFYLASSTGNNAPVSLCLYGYNGSTWTQLFSPVTQFVKLWNNVNVEIPNSYKSYRMDVSGKKGTKGSYYGAYISDAQLYQDNYYYTAQRVIRVKLRDIVPATVTVMPYLYLNWNESSTNGSDVKIFAEVNSSTTTAPATWTHEITSETQLQQLSLLVPSQSFANNSNTTLWIKQVYTPERSNLGTPSLNSMTIEYVEDTP